MTTCKQCDATATVNFNWPTSNGPQAAPFCDAHAADWWKQYQHTSSGEALSIIPLPEKSEET